MQGAYGHFEVRSLLTQSMVTFPARDCLTCASPHPCFTALPLLHMKPECFPLLLFLPSYYT
jgi:hypothetical protein